MKKFIIPLLLLSIVVAGCTTQQNTIPQACTEEAKVCPDGSAVGRTGPNCEFAPCPMETGSVETGFITGTLGPQACDMEARVCLDGSTVARTGPNCEFVPCPEANMPNCTNVCLCPEGYRQEGESCTPKCHYSTPKCSTPSVQCQAAMGCLQGQ